MNCNWGWSGFWHPGGSIFWAFALIIIVFIGWQLFFSKKNTTSSLFCHSCNGQIDHSFMRCPYCGINLKSHCPECSKIIESTWGYCPTCGKVLHDKEQKGLRSGRKR